MKDKLTFNSLTKKYFISTIVGFSIFLIAAILFIFVLPALGVQEGGNISQTTTAGVLFSDFAETLAYPLLENPYTGSTVRSIYPPFAIYLCAPLSFICYNQITAYNNGTITLEQLSSEPLFRTAYFIYFIITFSLIMLFACLFLKKKGRLNPKIIVVIALFSPFILAFERGNNTLSVCLFTVMYFYFLEKDNWQKELGYLSLACAVSLRIYPILMIFYIIYKTKGKEKIFGVLKALGYTIVVALLPFVFMKEGFKNIEYLWDNFTGFNATDISEIGPDPYKYVIGDHFVVIGGEPSTWLSNASLATLIYYVINTINLALPFVNLTIVIDILTPIARFGLLALALVLPIIFNKANCKKEFALLAIGAYMLFPETCNGYCLSLLVVPFIFFLLDYENMEKKDKIFYAICFGVLACPAAYAFPVSLPNSLATVLLVTKAITIIFRENIALLKTKNA